MDMEGFFFRVQLHSIFFWVFIYMHWNAWYSKSIKFFLELCLFTDVCTIVILSSLICLTNSNTLILPVSFPCLSKESRPMNVPVLPTPALKTIKKNPTCVHIHTRIPSNIGIDSNTVSFLSWNKHVAVFFPFCTFLILFNLMVLRKKISLLWAI